MNNFIEKPLDFLSFMGYIITMKERKMNKDTFLAGAVFGSCATFILVAIVIASLEKL